MARQTYRRVTTSKEKTSLINNKNMLLMEQFFKDKSTRTSEATIKNYRSDLIIFFTWVLDNLDNKFFVDIKKLEFSEFFSWCVSELQWGSARANRMRSTLSSLSQFIERFMDDEYPNYRNLILRAIESMPKEEKRDKTILTDEQVEWLLQELKKKDIQKACLFSLAVASGARFAELLRFTTDIIDPKHLAYQDVFLETLRPIKTKGRGRNGKMLYKYIIKDIFLPYYESWLVEREKIMSKNEKNHTSIFIKKDGSPAEEGTIRAWIKTIDDMIDVDFYIHAVRHYGVTFLSKIGLPEQLIKDIYGWESTLMVNIYDDSSSKDKNWAELDTLKNSL